eukprot:gb/GEZN01004253.1/.p1 GENE.gb/GEZN01004253.1/~~gb/GEZN01004253.1/.p1  ORF type:complete len:507 (-),score=78.89 gb/GEZN01004253.1/:480-1808(-)
MELLLNGGANIDDTNEMEYTALCQAAATRFDSTELLLKRGANIHHTNMEGNTALFMACLGGVHDCAELLLNRGANINHVNKVGDTALFFTLQEYEFVFYDCAELLIKRGANVNHVNKNGFTPLARALVITEEVMIRLFLSHGANTQHLHSLIGKSDDDSNFLSGKPLTEDMVKKAEAWQKEDISAKARAGKLKLFDRPNLDTADQNGRTALISFAGSGEIAALTRLIETKAQVNNADKGGCTALSLASRNNHFACSELLLKKGANVNHVNQEGRTALFYACMFGHLPYVDLLLKARATINLADRTGWTPLAVATSDGYKEVARLLLRRGAEVNALKLLIGQKSWPCGPLLTKEMVEELELWQALDESADDDQAEDERDDQLSLGVEDALRAKITEILEKRSDQQALSITEVRWALADTFGSMIQQFKKWVTDLIREEYESWC